MPCAALSEDLAAASLAETPLVPSHARKSTITSLVAQLGDFIARRDNAKAARTANILGELYLKDSAPRQAQESFRQAQQLTSTKTTPEEYVNALNGLSATHLYLYEATPALEFARQALELSRAASYQRGAIWAYINFSYAYYQTAKYEEAVHAAQQALTLAQEIHFPRGEAKAYYHIGEAHMLLSNIEQSQSALENSILLWEQIGDVPEKISALMDLGFLFYRIGELQKSYNIFLQAQSIIDEANEPFLAGQIAMGLGETYSSYNIPEASVPYYKKALKFYRQVQFADGKAVAGWELGRIYALLGDFPQAHTLLNESLQVTQEAHAPFLTAVCRRFIGEVYLIEKKPEQALPQFQQALATYLELKNRREIALVLTFMGQAQQDLGHYTAALKTYQEALKTFQAVRDQPNEATLNYAVGQLKLRGGEMTAAGSFLQQSIALTEELRNNAVSEAQTSFFASVYSRYTNYVDWLMQMHAQQPSGGYLEKAFATHERARARNLLETLREAQVEIASDNPTLWERKRALEKQLRHEEAKYTDLLYQQEVEKAKISETTITQLKVQYTEVQKDLVQKNPHYADLTQARSLSLQEIRQEILDDDSLLLEYSIGENRSYLWVVTKADIFGYTLPGIEEIRIAAANVYNVLASPPQNPEHEVTWRKATNDLSRLILAPAAAHLGKRRIIVVADGVLNYIPFQALPAPDDNEPLVAKHEIINAPSASVLGLIAQETAQRQPAGRTLAAFGDPIFRSNYLAKTQKDAPEQLAAAQNLDNERFYQTLRDVESDGFNPDKLRGLLYAGRELSNLRSLAPDALIAADFDATRDKLQQTDLRQYRVLHFATHGLLNEKRPENSGLVMSLMTREGKPQEGFVTLSDIYNLRAPVDLVVLSACHTALGKDVRGEGLIGLTRGFMYAGASSVAASLWKADDEAAAELMKRFYTKMLNEGQPPAAALRAAQNSMRLEKEWSSPYYWAAFTIQGEYRRTIQPAPHSSLRLSRSTATGSGVAMAVSAGLVWWYRRRRRKLAIN